MKFQKFHAMEVVTDCDYCGEISLCKHPEDYVNGGTICGSCERKLFSPEAKAERASRNESAK
mgnify:FL=1